MTKRNILYLARGGPISGSQRQLLNLLSHIDRTVYEPIVICSEGGDTANRLARMNIETFVHPRLYGWRSFCYILHRYFLLSVLLRQCSKYKIDLVHCSYPWYGQYALSLAQQLHCPCVIHARSPIQSAQAKKFGIRRADSIIAISVRIRNDLIDIGIESEKIHLIFDSINVDQFRPQSPDTHSCNPNKKIVFGLIGRIQPAKYQMEFVAAASLLATRNQEARFVIIGEERDAPYAQSIKNYIQSAGLSDRICISGRSENMPETLNRLDVLVSLSGGSVMYEALACGVPVLSAGFTNKANSVYVVDDFNAIVLDNRNPAHIAAAMEKLLTDDTYRRSLADNTRSHVLRHLSSSAMAVYTQALYKRLLSHRQTALKDKGSQTTCAMG